MDLNKMCLTAEELQNLQEDIEAMIDVIQQIKNDIEPIIKEIIGYTPTLWDNLLCCACGGKIRHLAFHAKKTKVRKKNWRRMQKQFWKVMKHGR